MMRINDQMMNAIASYMNDDVREETHATMAPCSNEAFLIGYLIRIPDQEEEEDFESLLENEFGIKYEDIEEICKNLSEEEDRLATYGIRS